MSAAMTNAEFDPEQQLRRMTRRSFATGGIAALVGTAGLWWLKSAKLDDGISWPLRKVLQFNERVSQAYFGPDRLAPTFDVSRAKEPRVNGKIGLKPMLDVERWRVDVLSRGEKPVVERSLPIGAIHELPRFEMVTEFKMRRRLEPGRTVGRSTALRFHREVRREVDQADRSDSVRERTRGRLLGQTGLRLVSGALNEDESLRSSRLIKAGAQSR